MLDRLLELLEHTVFPDNEIKTGRDAHALDGDNTWSSLLSYYTRYEEANDWEAIVYLAKSGSTPISIPTWPETVHLKKNRNKIN